MEEKEIDRKNLQNMLRNSDMGADYYIDIIEQCLTLEDVEDKVIKPLLRAGAISETLVVKQMFYTPIARLAGLNVSRSTIHSHFSDCVSAVKKEKNIPRLAKTQDEGGITYLTEISAKNEKILREIVRQLNHSGEVEVKVLGQYRKLVLDFGSSSTSMVEDKDPYDNIGNTLQFIRFKPSNYKYYYTLQLTGTQEDIDAALRILGIYY